MTADLISDALLKATKELNPKYGDIFHSDQSSQFCSHRYQELLTMLGLISSISERGECWDNVVAESFWANVIRDNLPISGGFSSMAEAKRVIEKWILYYNGLSPHSALGMRSPYQYRQENLN